jgi:predicted ATP-grasp superfamily ATP-dependent carboligase
MKVFVYEYCCCQPANAGTAALALRGEGFAMLSALMADLAPLPDVESVALLAEDFPRVGFPCQRVTPAAEKVTFRRLAAKADWTIVIAPESDGILEERRGWTTDAGGRLLGPSIEAVRLTADKYALNAVFWAHRVPTPLTWRPIGRDLLPAVIKPRFGAGSTSTYRVDSVEEVERIKEAEPDVDFIGQQWIDGIPASVAVLISPRSRVPLMPAEQTLSSDGRFHYLGGRVPLPAPLANRARRLALRAVKAVPGLFGYVGVDLVLGQKRGYVIEINPRLTTSYVGLRRMASVNLAAAMLRLAEGKLIRLKWNDGHVRWTADGGTFLG